MSLVESFKEYVASNGLLAHGDRVLLAVSGGVDSMVLMRLMSDAGYRFAVAHCNFQLRGAESDGDELLVEQEAARYGVAYHSTRFDTEGVMAETGESMEMAARRLRYAWFEELCERHDYDVVAVAHHLDDSIETHFINMLRGTGLRGLTGIAVHNRRVVRPLMFATREAILEFANVNNVPFREDSSNASTKYLRNRIRHEIVPKLREINPQFASIMRRNMSRLDEAQCFIDASIALIKERVLSVEGGAHVLRVDRIVATMPRNFVIYEILNSEFGFNASVVDDICRAIDRGTSGRRFHSHDMQAVVDRDRIIVVRRGVRTEGCVCTVEQGVESLCFNDTLFRFEYLDIDDVGTLNQGANVALVDADRLTFPLCVRVWQSGDAFVPFGMRNHKKVSNFLVDNKVLIVDKERQLLLLSGDDVVWLVGRRIDHRFSITNQTKRVLRVSAEQPFDNHG